MVRLRRSRTRPAQRALRCDPRGRLVDGRHSRPLSRAKPARKHTRPAFVCADLEARRLVDALALGGVAIRPAFTGPARNGSGGARSLWTERRARAPAGRL